MPWLLILEVLRSPDTTTICTDFSWLNTYND